MLSMNIAVAPSATAAIPPASSTSGPSTTSTPVTPSRNPPTCSVLIRSWSSIAASSAVSTGLSAWNSEPSTAESPRSKARNIIENCTAFMARPISATRASTGRDIRGDRRSATATSAPRAAAASTNLHPSTVSGAAARTAAGPAM